MTAEQLFRFSRTISSWRRSKYMIAGVLTSVFACLTVMSLTVHAAAPPTTMNFQGRLTNSSGAIVADGLYNIKFRLFNVSSGGSAVWTETRETTNRVQVTNGLFSVRAGSVTALSASLFDNASSLYFEVELPTPGTATCSTAACASFTEGAMTPRSQLSTSAYSFNSDTLDGIDSASFAQVGAANTFTAANVFNSTVTIGSANSATKFVVQDNSTVALLTADTSSTVVKVGTTSAGTLTNVRLLSTSAEFTGTVRIGTSTNGLDISGTGIVLAGTARPTRTITFAPEYAGATFSGDGTNNTGTLTSDFCSASALLNINTTACNNTGDEHNYYAWTTTQGSVQDYDLYIRYRMPADYDTGSMANMRIWGWGTTSANEIVKLDFYKGSGTACSTITNAITANTTWNEATSASPLGACTVNAGDLVTFKVRVAAGTNNTARAGEIRFEYRSKF